MSIELFKWKAFRLPKVIFRKLGREKAYGMFDGINTIEIDETLNGKRQFEILCHEYIHWENKFLTEEEVIQRSRKLTDFLWKLGYRKVDNTEKHIKA